VVINVKWRRSGLALDGRSHRNALRDDVANPSSSRTAERMRRYRARRRAAGLVEQRKWVEPDSADVWSDHRVLDVRSLALHALVARKLMKDPRVVERARENLKRWSARDAGNPAPHIREWEEVLKGTPDDIACFLVSTSEDAVRLRQSSPFAGALSPAVRRALLDLFRERSP